MLTKTDSVKPTALAAKISEVEALARRHAAAYPQIAITSSQTGLGLPELRADLAGLALPPAMA